MVQTKEEIQRTFGNMLRKRRTQMGISQEELANRAGLDRTYISLIERGHRTPSIYTLLAIYHQLDVSAADQIRELESLYRS